MHEITGTEVDRGNQENSKYNSGHFLDSVNLPRDHFYREYVSLGSRACPICHNHHLVIRRIKYALETGWQWTCKACQLKWQEPQITVGKSFCGK